MSYVDSLYDRRKDVIRVAERINGKRILRDINPLYEFYAEDPDGRVKSVTGATVSKMNFKTAKEMRAKAEILKASNIGVFESDVNILNKTLAHHYKGQNPPDLNILFFDIETDFCKTRGYAPVDDPFNKITGISMYKDWCNELVNLVLKPKNMSIQEAEDIVSSFDDDEATVVLFTDEVKMLNVFFDHIEDSDVLSGWNSEFYDIPYMVNRVEKVMAKAHTSRFCLWNETPKLRMAESFGNQVPTYDLIGRIHMDYLNLYKKHTYQELPSYKLDYIGEKEVNQKKVEYNGTLDSLYNDDFENFIRYGNQDSKLLKLLNDKLKFISLHNQMAHDECVNIATTMGSVAIIDTAIINEIHSWGEVVFDKSYKADPEHGAAGAWVADPVTGVHDFVGCIDLNSLYPSVLRSLKMSTESIIGQVRHTLTNEFLNARIQEQKDKYKGSVFEPSWTEAWHGLFACIEHTRIMEKTDDLLIVDLEDGTSIEMSAADLHNFIFAPNSNIVISANGTLFDNSKKGAIPSILTRWYAERKKMQKRVEDYKRLACTSTLEEEQGIILSDEDSAALAKALGRL